MTLTRRVRPVDVTDHPEHRAIPMDRMEVREDSDENTLVLEGYASTFEQYEMYGGPSNGYGWIEQLDRRAFDKTLREKPDLHLLVNHAGTPLARTKSGTLDLSVDDKGLKVVARLDKRDPDVQSLAVKMERGDMDEMSFAFRVKAQKWEATDEFPEDDQALRTITEVSLHKGDVSVVNFGANPTTSVGLRSLPEALRFLAEADEDELAEVRSDEDLVKRAIEKLGGKGSVHIENLHIGTTKAEERIDVIVQGGGGDGAAGTILDDAPINVVEDAPESEGREESDELGIQGLSPVAYEAIKEIVRSILGVAESEESEERDETEEEEARDEEAEEAESGISLREAFAEMGVDSESDELSIAEIEALLDNE
ncbi:capsid maturation protease [Mycobacterium phage Schatzie]|uniref:Capsid maturation protease n=2 Tax=Omegavirus baka TaxID=1034099 RepID=A0A3S9UAQ7_9CAUD|nr:head maturation protease [Mycobacterium phage Baka]AXQ52250.1 capsid maturation protease [Mycobacterium phage EricMillard]AZS07353.1 capsid maturation protease [Mycobacterium phage Duke13]QBI99963.1 capsid maturation protease [Mycobacterium phage Phoebus]QCO93701.1 capsid maturation protease [Mycobacterium phage Schatzie]QDM55594.1 capsid maturation protease [Mycobacterium phage HokkenD]